MMDDTIDQDLQEIAAQIDLDITPIMSKELLDDIQAWEDIDQLFPDFGIVMQTDFDDSPWKGQWNQFAQLVSHPDPDVKAQMERYGREFSNILDFRIHFADAIEIKGWHLIDPADDRMGGDTMKLARAIVMQLQEQVNKVLSNPNRINFNEMARLQQWYKKELQGHYINHPMELVQVMQRMLRKEQSIINLASRRVKEAVGNASLPTCHARKEESQMERIHVVVNEISALEALVHDASVRLERIVMEFQQLQICTSGNIQALDRYNIEAISNAEEKKNVTTLYKLRESIIKNKQLLITIHQEQLLHQYQTLVSKIKQEILLWQRIQAYANNGRYLPDTCDINQLEDCCNPLAKLLNTSLEQVFRIKSLEVDTAINEQQTVNLLESVRQQYENVIKDLVENTLVVEKQPPQVLMKDKKFVCQLRHLVGDGLTSHQFRFDTQVWLISTEAARSLLESDHLKEIKPSGQIFNNTAKADFSEQTKQLHVHMRNMSLRMRQRGDRGRADSVAEEKFCMVFRSFISLRFPTNNECKVVAQTTSLPIVVISHGKQDADAQATIFWDNAFSEESRRPFEVTDVVPWKTMLSELNCLWQKSCQEGPGSPPGLGLDDDAMRYLTNKLLGRDEGNCNITWRQFNRDQLPGMPFTFWKWFFMIMELVSSTCVRKYWNAGIVKGFISKAECQKLLMQRQLGTFLFRFSDSLLGAISISCYTFSNISGQNEVGHLEPDTIAKLKTRSLPDTVKDIQFLHFLYPNKPKNEVFQSYYTPDKPTTGSIYWPKHLQVVPGMGNQQFMHSFPPQSPNISSPRTGSGLLSPQASMNALSPPMSGGYDGEMYDMSPSHVRPQSNSMMEQ